MPDRYYATGAITAVTATPGDTALGLIGSALTRAKVYNYVLSVLGSPVADYILDWLVRRFTAVGTYTAVTPVQIDPGAPAAQLTAGENYTVEPTYTVEQADLGSHMRATFQWYAPPGGEIVLAASATQGIGFTPIHASYASSAQASAYWQE